MIVDGARDRKAQLFAHAAYYNNKSYVAAFLLALFFGPLGFFYATTIGGVIMLVGCGAAFFFFSWVGLIVGWCACVVIAPIAVAFHNI